VGKRFDRLPTRASINRCYLGLIRQAQRNFSMDYCVQLGFDNINAPEMNGYGVDHIKVVEGLGFKAIRVHKPEDFASAIEQAERWMIEYQVPVVVEVILERVTNIAMGTEINNVVEFEDIATAKQDAPTAVALLD
jgi:tartronate-semialdehyde synthase